MKQLMYVFPSLLLLSFGAACSTDDSPTGSMDENEIQNNLTFAWESGSEVVMGTDYAICCGIWEPGFNDRNALKIFFYDLSLEQASWKLFIAVDEITIDNPYTLPTDQATLWMFLNDPTSGNELSSTLEGSSGTITINSLDCGPPVTVTVMIDATIASEFFQGPSVKVLGTFSATIFSNPAPFGCDFSL